LANHTDKIHPACKKYMCKDCTWMNCAFTPNEKNSLGCYAQLRARNIEIYKDEEMPKGFRAYGSNRHFKILIFEHYNDYLLDNVELDIPIWKAKLDKDYTIVKIFQPKISNTYHVIYLENCLDSINCKEITPEISKDWDS